MTDYTLPSFGTINLAALEDYYEAGLTFNGVEIRADLNFESSTVEQKHMEPVKKMLENLATFDKKNKEYIQNDYKSEDGDTVRYYIEHHLEEVDQETLANLVDFNNDSLTPEVQLLGKLQLIRIGFYPGQEDLFAVFDYSIGEEITDQLVVINTDKDGNLDYMTMES